MYDQHVIVPGSLRNNAQGFELGIRLPYYRGQWLSIVEDIALTVDGTRHPREALRFSVRGRVFSLDEMEAATTERWEFGEVATLSVAGPRLPPGEHEVTVAEQLRISYLPWVPTTTCSQRMAVS